MSIVNYRLAGAMMLLAAAVLSAHAQPQPDTCQVLAVQGRITEIKGALMTVKTPDGYPGVGPGVHAQFVTVGPAYQVDLSHARILMPGGKQVDKVPLAVGDRVVAVLIGADSAPYSASVVERIAPSDKIVTH